VHRSDVTGLGDSLPGWAGNTGAIGFTPGLKHNQKLSGEPLCNEFSRAVNVFLVGGEHFLPNSLPNSIGITQLPLCGFLPPRGLAIFNP
jgi:hypothetical protein